MNWGPIYKMGAYLTIISRLSYDNAKVTIDLRRRLIYKTSYEGRTVFLRYDVVEADSVNSFKSRLDK